jgi:hypothetical protein
VYVEDPEHRLVALPPFSRQRPRRLNTLLNSPIF